MSRRPDPDDNFQPVRKRGRRGPLHASQQNKGRLKRVNKYGYTRRRGR